MHIHPPGNKINRIGLVFILFVGRLVFALEVFQNVENTLSLLTRNHSTPCAATRLLRLKNPRRNRYPLDLFGKEEISPDNYSCFFEPVKLHQETHSCSHSHFHCPIKQEYIPITMTGFENASNQICHTLKFLEEEEEDNRSEQSSPPVNLIIIGGSVTWGGYAGGCMEGTCAELKPNGFCATGSGGDCAWVQTIVKYLQHRYTNNNSRLKVIDLSEGGTTSCTLLYTLIQRLESRNVTLTSRDIILYDYSVNDGICFRGRMSRLQKCMVDTFEKLAQYSIDGLPPSIILLEFYPFRDLNVVTMQFPESNNSYKNRIYHELTYSNVYREVARKFHLPIISYRDLFWHPLFRADLKQYPKLEYIVEYKWARNGYNVDVHPPWVVHDVYSDVIAGALELTHLLCNNKIRNSLVEIDVDPWAILQNNESAPVVKVLLNVEATTTTAPYLTPEEVSHLPYGWKLYQDRLGKPGWIVQQPSNVQTPLSSAALTFSAPYRVRSNRLGFTPPSSFATLEIAFMQTYRNAGAFHVEVCDVFVPTWPDNSLAMDTLIVEHFTTLEVAVYKVDLERVQNHKVCKKNGGLVVVKIVHEYLGDYLEERAAQKVKITSVRLTVPTQSKNHKSESTPGNMRLIV
jgi:hypothetical protein